MTASVLALLAAFAFALGTVLQQRGTLQTSAAEGAPRFLAEIIRNPLRDCVVRCSWPAAGRYHPARIRSLVDLRPHYRISDATCWLGRQIGIVALWAAPFSP